MLCSFTHPGETVELFRGWAAWLILDFLVGALIGPGQQARALAAVIGLFVLAVATGNCSGVKKGEDVLP